MWSFVTGFFHLAYVFKVPPCCSLYQYFILFYCLIISHCMNGAWLLSTSWNGLDVYLQWLQTMKANECLSKSQWTRIILWQHHGSEINTISSWASYEFIILGKEEDFLLVKWHWLAGTGILCVPNLVCLIPHCFFSPYKQRAWARSLLNLSSREQVDKDKGWEGKMSRGQRRKYQEILVLGTHEQSKREKIISGAPSPLQDHCPFLSYTNLIFQTVMADFEAIQRGSFEVCILQSYQQSWNCDCSYTLIFTFIHLSSMRARLVFILFIVCRVHSKCSVFVDWTYWANGETQW